MTDKLREAAQQALTTIEATLGTLTAANEQGKLTDTIWFSRHETLFDYLVSEAEALRAAMAEQPAEQEPVLFIHPETFAMDAAHVGVWKPGHELPWDIPLYTAPQTAKREPLTDEEMGKIINAHWGVSVWEMARAIERAHGIGE